jgi:hypothetical protein
MQESDWKSQAFSWREFLENVQLETLNAIEDNIKISLSKVGCEDGRSVESNMGFLVPVNVSLICCLCVLRF